ncbi:hypothetical protein DL93DRAFT_545736 [Clavulina sp. PMI_390]|nr:hypothetical protein DL93DRAFT_545736 [Clavulina sp. PMI_390]
MASLFQHSFHHSHTYDRTLYSVHEPHDLFCCFLLDTYSILYLLFFFWQLFLHRLYVLAYVHEHPTPPNVTSGLEAAAPSKSCSLFPYHTLGLSRMNHGLYCAFDKSLH